MYRMEWRITKEFRGGRVKPDSRFSLRRCSGTHMSARRLLDNGEPLLRQAHEHQKYTRAHLLAAVREGISGLRPASYSYRMPVATTA